MPVIAKKKEISTTSEGQVAPAYHTWKKYVNWERPKKENGQKDIFYYKDRGPVICRSNQEGLFTRNSQSHPNFYWHKTMKKKN